MAESWYESSYDVVVVGAGYWGAACTVQLRRRGLRVLCVDAGEPRAASPNSAGLVRPASLRGLIVRKLIPADWDPEAVERSLEFLIKNTPIYSTREYFENLAVGSPGRMREPMWVLPYPDDLTGLAKALRVAVRRVEMRLNGVSVVTDNYSIETRGVVVAVGIWTTPLLEASGLIGPVVETLRGRSLILDGVEPVGVPRTYMVSPYREYTLRSWGTYARWGDTAERTVGGANLDGAPRSFMGTLERVAPGARVIRVNSGYRPITKQFVARPLDDAPRVFVATGGHRVGLGFAGYVGLRAADWAEKEL